MSHKKFIKDLTKIKKDLGQLSVKSDTTPLRNNLISLLIVTVGEDSPHIDFVRDLTFTPEGVITCYGQDFYEESWNKASKDLASYIDNLITTYEYKNKYPEPLKYTSKVTIPWLFKNIPVKTIFWLLSLLFVAYSMGVRYHLPTERLRNSIWQQVKESVVKLPQEKQTTEIDLQNTKLPPKHKTNKSLKTDFATLAA